MGRQVGQTAAAIDHYFFERLRKTVQDLDITSR